MSALLEMLQKFRQVWPKRGWSWDTRFSCVASAFGLDLQDEARAAAKLIFAHRWSHDNVDQAPPIIQQIAEQTGGLRADQYVFATKPVASAIAYALWWPWGDEQTISLRIGIVGGGTGDWENELRAAFGVEL